MEWKELAREIDRTVESLRPATTLIFTDYNVKEAILPKLADSETVNKTSVVAVTPGEQHKDIASVSMIWQALIDTGATRKSLVINIGGGMVTDVGGFAAATFKRGIRYINVPTTLLGAVDAATGGKTGINFGGLKNEAGAFHLPERVIISSLPLASLSDEQIMAGYGEVLKTALIADEDFYRQLIDIERVINDAGEMERIMKRCVEIKEEVVKADPKEQGLRKILNFGHTAGHAFESLSFAKAESGKGKALPHGMAVAHGLLVELILSSELQGLEKEEVGRYARLLRRYYPASGFKEEDIDEAIRLMAHDKKNSRGGQPNFTLLETVGVPVIDCYPSEQVIRNAFNLYLESQA